MALRIGEQSPTVSGGCLCCDACRCHSVATEIRLQTGWRVNYALMLSLGSEYRFGYTAWTASTNERISVAIGTSTVGISLPFMAVPVLIALPCSINRFEAVVSLSNTSTSHVYGHLFRGSAWFPLRWKCIEGTIPIRGRRPTAQKAVGLGLMKVLPWHMGQSVLRTCCADLSAFAILFVLHTLGTSQASIPSVLF